MKTFSVAGTSTKNGVTKVRFANDFVNRFKILIKNGHEDINLIELGGEFTKAEIIKILSAHPSFENEIAQSAIYEYAVRNCREIASELKQEKDLITG